MGVFGNDKMTGEVEQWREIHARPYELSHVQKECLYAALRKLSKREKK